MSGALGKIAEREIFKSGGLPRRGRKVNFCIILGLPGIICSRLPREGDKRDEVGVWEEMEAST